MQLLWSANGDYPLTLRLNNLAKRRRDLGPVQRVALVILPSSYMIDVLTPSGRSIPRTQEDMAAVFNQTIAYSGSYELEGARLSTVVQATALKSYSDRRGI